MDEYIRPPNTHWYIHKPSYYIILHNYGFCDIREATYVVPKQSDCIHNIVTITTNMVHFCCMYVSQHLFTVVYGINKQGDHKKLAVCLKLTEHVAKGYSYMHVCR